MAWKMCKVQLRLLTPLHVGWLKQGNLQRTRPYVTGKVLWGALTARLTRDHFNGSNYEQVGKRVNEQLAFSYFYPVSSETLDLWPWGKGADEFAWRYLQSYASTALNYAHNRAAEGSLHETEYIAPQTRDGEPVSLLGYIFEQEGCNLKWQEALSRLQLGGERGYGWGRVRLKGESQEKGEPQETGEFFPGWQVDLSGERPQLKAADGKAVFYAHVQAQGVQGRGTIEPFLGRETASDGRHGESLSQALICWAPGGEADKVQVRIGRFGVWVVE